MWEGSWMKDRQAGEQRSWEIQLRGQRLASAMEANPGKGSKNNDATRHTEGSEGSEGSEGYEGHEDQNHDAGTSMQSPADGIAVLLRQVLICLGNGTYADDIDALSFSLNHLFHRVNF